MRLRPFRSSDWPQVLALWVAAWTQARADIDFSARATWLEELFARSAEEGARIVVAEDNGILGFVLFDPARQWLEQIAVAPRAQGRGVARALMAEAKAACPGGLGLSVNADNFAALAFYDREGFVREGEGINPLSGLPTLTLRFTPPPAPRSPR
ncbi:putative acetyltransferase [Rhodoblastus acidophilus]|uniref:GNAT family N-acetyltransferase n=1 Tax=Rhodoblastus acidophilus TaxID=1074 RepID=UPI0022240934|nr:N-acetyltransferase [Rhodoblastus acidophilus]MCW2282349.1 putative acetyltransferase [Rhodoblastus acidophilus]MCW2331246.1 putative acetyltransferase [Rhodoblastus acidophilus]